MKIITIIQMLQTSLLLIPIIPIIPLFRKKNKIKRLKDSQKKDIKVFAVIPAHNEENVIRGIVSDCIANGFDHIYVILDACTDRTAEVIRNEFNAVMDHITFIKVYQHNKGKAIQKALRRILINKKNDDILVFFDADNRIDYKFRDNIIINRDIVQTRIFNKNFTNSISNYYAFIMDYASRIQQFLNLINLSGVLAGTGFYMKVKILRKYGFNIKTLIEDMEYTMQIKEKVYYDSYTKVYDEKPTELKAMLKQITRWLRGGYQILLEPNIFDIRKLYIALFPLMNMYYALTFPVNVLSLINISTVASLLISVLYYSVIIFPDTFQNVKIRDYLIFFFLNIIISSINVYALFTFHNHKWIRTKHSIS